MAGGGERTQTVELTDDEWRIVHAALRAYLQDFGHDEADVVALIKRALSKVPTGERFFET
jgi:hypothetical protein